ARDAGLAERHQQAAVRRELEDLVPSNRAGRTAGGQTEHVRVRVGVARPHIALAVDREPVRKRKHPLTKASQQRTGGVELQDRRLGAAYASGCAGRHRVEAAMEDPDVALRIEVGPDQLSPATTVQPGWNGRPAFHEAVRVGQLWSLSLWRSGCRDDDRHGADGSEGEQAREESEEGARE